MQPLFLNLTHKFRIFLHQKESKLACFSVKHKRRNKCLCDEDIENEVFFSELLENKVFSAGGIGSNF